MNKRGLVLSCLLYNLDVPRLHSAPVGRRWAGHIMVCRGTPPSSAGLPVLTFIACQENVRSQDVRSQDDTCAVMPGRWGLRDDLVGADVTQRLSVASQLSMAQEAAEALGLSVAADPRAQ